MEVKASAKNVGVSPKKLRRIIDTVRGRGVTEALTILGFLPSPSAVHVAKTIKSAAANAENNFQMDPDGLRVVRITADEALKLRRNQPMARGRAGLVHKRHSHITVVVDEGEQGRGA